MGRHDIGGWNHAVALSKLSVVQLWRVRGGLAIVATTPAPSTPWCLVTIGTECSSAVRGHVHTAALRTLRGLDARMFHVLDVWRYFQAVVVECNELMNRQ